VHLHCLESTLADTAAGPTALGLTTTLLSLGLDPPAIRRRILIFSFAAPLGAVVTFGAVKLFGRNVGIGQSSSEIDALGWWTGIVLLFSVSEAHCRPQFQCFIGRHTWGRN
jgi:hypothetical protein